MEFHIRHTDPHSAARQGELVLPQGRVQTPIFMPVGTQGTVKGLTPAQLLEIDAQILLANTYHLEMRPGSDLIAERGGLHRFMAWPRPILTDSGGFQVFSLAKQRTLSDAGVAFRSHLDGTPLLLTPESALAIQARLGSSIAMVLDVCPPGEAPYAEVEDAVRRTLLWARASRTRAEAAMSEGSQQAVFGIVQGGRYAQLRQRCAEELAAMEFPGYAIGGVSVGESEEQILEQVRITAPCLPQEKPRYVMGVGTPPQLLNMVTSGADMFDCVMPTREARHGIAYTSHGRLQLKNHRFRNDDRPLDAHLDNYTCRHFSRAYLRHLIVSGELLGQTLLSLHNCHFFLDLMRQAREHLSAGDFTPWRAAWLKHYQEALASHGED